VTGSSCLAGVDGLLDHDMTDSVPLKVVEVHLCDSADMWDGHVEGVLVAYSPCDGSERRVNLNVPGATGFNGNFHVIHACKM